jgi:hypothetical protein
MALGLKRDFEHFIPAEFCGVTAQQTAKYYKTDNVRET